MSNLPQLPASTTPAHSPRPARRSGSTLASLTRLAVGGVLLGVDELLQRLPDWEEKAAEACQNQASGLPPDDPPSPVLHSETTYRLVGAVFKAEQALGGSLDTFSRIEQTLWRRTLLLRAPLNYTLYVLHLTDAFDALVERGQQEVDGWEALGRRETPHAHQLARLAVAGSVDESVSYLSENEEVRDLVLQQGSGLTERAVDEARTRAVSADLLVAGLVKRILRR